MLTEIILFSVLLLALGIMLFFALLPFIFITVGIIVFFTGHFIFGLILVLIGLVLCK